MPKKYFSLFLSCLQRLLQHVIEILTLFQNVEILSMKVTKKIKSIQMFKQPTDTILQVCFNSGLVNSLPFKPMS